MHVRRGVGNEKSQSQEDTCYKMVFIKCSWSHKIMEMENRVIVTEFTKGVGAGEEEVQM